MRSKTERRPRKTGPGKGPSEARLLDDAAAVVSGISLSPRPEIVGRVESIADGLAIVSGLPEAELGETLDFGNGIMGFVFSLEEGSCRNAQGCPAGAPAASATAPGTAGAGKA
jgi:F-type H+-transporting ATPase subunit alpha